MTVLTWPGAPVSGIRRVLRTAVGGSASPFTMTEQVQDWGGEVWDYEIDVPPQRDRSGRALEAFFNQLGGRRGRFLFCDPSIRNAPAGSPVVALARRNLLSYTEAFDNSYWNKSNLNLTADTATAPDGTTTADLLAPNSSSASQLARNPASALVIGQSYTFSVYVKVAGLDWVRINLAGSVPSQWLFVNLQTGDVGLNSNASVRSIVSVGDGWWRLSVGAVATATGNTAVSVQPRIANSFAAFAGDGTSGIFIWGAQLEEGPLSDYQPILGASYTAPGVGANTLPTTGWTGPMDAGAFFSLGSGANTRLYQLTRDVTPSTDGRADIHFTPRLRFAPVEGEPIEVERPHVLLRLNGPIPATISTAKNYTFSVQAREAI